MCGETLGASFVGWWTFPLALFEKLLEKPAEPQLLGKVTVHHVGSSSVHSSSASMVHSIRILSGLVVELWYFLLLKF